MFQLQSPLAAAFVAAMERLGPFEPSPALAIAVSGGADSLALAILVTDWVQRQGGRTLALVVDHGLRQASADEAGITLQRLAGLDIPSRLFRLSNLNHGPALAERARIMRYAILTDACRAAGLLHLLLGHHARDQVETLAMRVVRNSQTHGLAGMSALSETSGVRLLRPLLEVEPEVMRKFLVGKGIDWVEDPSNQDMRAMRPRLRHGLNNLRGGTTLPRAMAAVAHLRAREETETANELARRVTIRPEGFALLSPGRIGSAALSALIRSIGGMPYPASPSQISDLAAQPRPATVGGVRIMAAGRFGDGLLVVREEAAVMEPIDASSDIFWDNRFRLLGHGTIPGGSKIGKLGPDAARFRRTSNLPSAVLRTLPALRFGKVLAAVPHLGYGFPENDVRMTVLFSPRKPVAGPCFVPAS